MTGAEVAVDNPRVDSVSTLLLKAWPFFAPSVCTSRGDHLGDPSGSIARSMPVSIRDAADDGFFTLDFALGVWNDSSADATDDDEDE